MTTVTHLPDEIIAKILEYKDITVEDIVHLKSTCRRLKYTTFSTKFWKKKYFQRFPLSERIHDKEKREKFINHLEECVKCLEEVRHYVSIMSYNNLSDNEEMELNKLLRFTAEHSIIYYYVLDEIDRIISTQLSRYDSNLTFKYYFGQIYHWLKQCRLIYKQTKFIHMPKEKLLLEKQITIIAQYFQPHMSYSIIDALLNDIAEKVLFRLQIINPTYSIFSTSSEQFTLWGENNINDNFWNSTEAKQIMRILKNTILFHLNVHQLFKTLHVEEQFIKYISDCKNLYYEKFLSSLICHSVARRLGVHCYLKYFSDFIMHILSEPIYYTASDQSTKYNNNCYYRVSSLLHIPNIPVEGICHFTRPLDPLHNILQIRHLAYNFLGRRNCFNLCVRTNKFHKKRRQVSYKWNMMYILDFLSRCLSGKIKHIHMDNEYTHVTRSIKDRSNIVTNDRLGIRKKKIKFTIGMIVRHSSTLSQTLCDFINHDGVIIGWHYKCKAAFVHENLNSLVPHLSECHENRHIYHSCRYQTCESYKSKFICQPHYIILTNNNWICYVPQGKLSKCPPKWINNAEIGRYFSAFKGTYYVPNENLARNYPTDIAVMHKILSNQ